MVAAISADAAPSPPPSLFETPSQRQILRLRAVPKGGGTPAMSVSVAAPERFAPEPLDFSEPSKPKKESSLLLSEFLDQGVLLQNLEQLSRTAPRTKSRSYAEIGTDIGTDIGHGANRCLGKAGEESDGTGADETRALIGQAIASEAEILWQDGLGQDGLGQDSVQQDDVDTSSSACSNPASSNPGFPLLGQDGSDNSANAAFSLRDIQVLGSSIFGSQDLATLIAAFQNRFLLPEELRRLSDQITQLYLTRGYITSRALEPLVEGDRATIQIIEGSIERIDISGTQRVSQDYIRRRLSLGTAQPLNTNRLEEQLKLLRSNPLFEEFNANLKAGSGLGQSILSVTVREAKPTTIQLGSNNEVPPSVGGEQFGVQAQHQNLTGGGDRLSGSYNFSRTLGSQQYGLTYSTPVNPKNGTVTASAQVTRTRITQDDFEAFDIRGTSERYALTYRQPIIRRPQQELALSAGFVYQDGQTFLFDDRPTPFGIGPDEDGVSRTSVIQFGQDYIKRQASGAWVLQSQFNLGTGLLDATNNQDSIPDGQFLSWLGQVQRVQRLGKDHLLIAQGALQLTPDALLPSQQFSIGGGKSIRGYRQNARSGDNGFRISVEDRITLQRDAAGASTLQLVPFAEVGKVWNVRDNPNQSSDQRLLASTGIGVIWQPKPEVMLRVDYGVPLIDLGDRGNSLQEQGLHFNASYRF